MPTKAKYFVVAKMDNDKLTVVKESKGFRHKQQAQMYAATLASSGWSVVDLEVLLD